MKIKTSELIDEKLDWAVSEAEGCSYGDYFEDGLRNCRKWSTDWSQGGLIIEREGGFELKVWLESSPDTKCEAHIHNYEGDWIEFGPTPLIAAMRCFVAAKLGDVVEIPEELK